MHLSKTIFVVAVSSLSITLAGCASQRYAPMPTGQTYPAPAASYPARTAPSQSYGTVESIAAEPVDANAGIGAGTIVGGVVGGLLGNQVGGGNGKKVATVAGVIGGAMIGNQIERNAQTQQGHYTYRLAIRLDSGGYRTVLQDGIDGLSVGSRVRIANGIAYRY